MLLDPARVDWGAYQAIKPYQDPGWGNKANRYNLLLRMFEATMLQFMDKVEEVAGVFTVRKKVERLDLQEKVWTRLVWDRRRVNFECRRAPWVPAGSPATLGLLELSPSMPQGGTIGTYQGDELAPGFVLPELDARELEASAQATRRRRPRPSAGPRGARARATVMG